MCKEGKVRKYPGFTLLEMLAVLAILTILGSVTISSFSGLEKSVKVTQEVLNISQDIRNLQRSAMLLEREVDESWLYGLGIDFSEYESTGRYVFFKWCSIYSGYGAKETRGELPDFDDEYPVAPGNGHLPRGHWEDECSVDNMLPSSYLVEWKKGTPTLTDTKLNPTLGNDISYILFESVSGRSFFYDSDGELVNYDSSGELVASPINFELGISSGAIDNGVSVNHLSGNVNILNDVATEEEDGPDIPDPPSPVI